ncbi:MAG: chemotaxis protein CheW [Desulfobulbaceae bacterium]|nr:MAG: chemotaxis protein CheW [Desulfobulbaceae bacterium]
MTDQATINHAGKYLTFVLAEESYGIPILKVKEIIGMMKITEMPQMPSFMKGVVNLRDHIIPIIDLRQKFAMPPADYTERTCIIVIEAERSEQQARTIGIIVDGVSEVVNIKEEQIEPAPAFAKDNDNRYILGMAKVDDDVKILLEIDKTLSSSEIKDLTETI